MSHGVPFKIPEAIRKYLNLRPSLNEVVHLEDQKKLVEVMLAANNVHRRPTLLVDEENVGVQHPASIVVSERESLADLFALIYAYISLERRKIITEDEARRIAMRCLSINSLNKVHFIKQHPKPAARPGMASWISTKTLISPNPWLIRCKSLSWEKFIREAYFCLKFAFELFPKDIRLIHSAIVCTAAGWFDKLIATQKSTPATVFYWDETMKVVWLSFEKFVT